MAYINTTMYNDTCNGTDWIHLKISFVLYVIYICIMVTDISLIILPYLSTYILGSRTRYYKLVPWQDKRLIEDERDCPEYMLYKNKILKRKKKRNRNSEQIWCDSFRHCKKSLSLFSLHRSPTSIERWMDGRHWFRNTKI